VTSWRLAAPAAELEPAGREATEALLRLARASNAVRFAYNVLVEHDAADSPATRRHRLNAWLQLCRTLTEALALTAALRPGLAADGDPRSDEFAPLVDDPGVAAFADEVIARLAHGARLGAAPPRLRPAGDPVVFATGQGRAPGAAYYALADELVVRPALELRAAGNAFQDAVKEPMADTATVAERWLEAADRVIARILRTQPWRFEAEPEPGAPAAGTGP
jgi:hypothetical protein